MATKTFCDACGKEGRVNRFSYRCHLTPILEGKFVSGYVDGDMNPVSGRDDYVELCNKCYNEVVIPAINSLKAIKERN